MSSNNLIVVLRRHLRSALRKRRWEDVKALLEKLRAEEPLACATRGFELEFFVETRHFDEADALAEQLLTQFPDSSRIHFLAGKLAYRRKNYAFAAERFRESNRLHSHWRSRYWLGKTLTQSGEFDEAQSLLEEALPHYRGVRRDLAWLHERKGNLERAMAYLQEVLEDDPENESVKANLSRLKAQLLDPEEMVEEIGSLAAFGETVPQHLTGAYVKNLFRTGRGKEAREWVAAHADELKTGNGVDVAWACFHAQQYDLAFRLFLRFHEGNFKKYKYLNAMEAAAKKCGEVGALIEAYQTLAGRERNFYGRIKRLTRFV